MEFNDNVLKMVSFFIFKMKEPKYYKAKIRGIIEMQSQCFEAFEIIKTIF